MKITLLPLLLLISTVLAYFSSSEIEIINLHHQLQPKKSKSDSKSRNFYSFLQLDSHKAKESEIESNYKKLSRKWHPDKFKGSKEKRKAEQKFEKLSIIISILRDVEKRRIYDYYLSKGFPEYNPKLGRYVFKNRYQPSILIVLTILVVIFNFIQWIVLKLNRKQIAKRIDKLLVDVKSKADRMESPKVMELPDDYAADDLTVWPVGDKLVPYADKLFIIKSDRSVWLYDGKIEDEDDQREAVKKISENDQFNLIGFKKQQLNRKERRAKQRESGDDDSDELRVIEVKEESASVELKELFFFKFLFFLWNSTIGKLSKNQTERTTEEKEREDEKETEKETEKEIIKGKFDDKIITKKNESDLVLPNGKILHSRKRK